QLLVKLCSYPYPAEELARMDDLTLLFSAITSPCPTHNIVWRKNAAEILTTISRHGLTDAVVSYIHSKGCMALCVDNMRRLTFGNPLEIVEMFVTVFCFLKDSSQVSQILLDDFKASQGYIFLSDFLLKFDTSRTQSIEVQAAIRNLVLMISSLCMCGFNELRPPQAQINALFKMARISPECLRLHPEETCVRNVYAFQVLQTVFLKATSTHTVLHYTGCHFSHNNVFKDVYREVGILEVFVTCLNRYADHVRKITKDDENAVVKETETED
ncbi:hypothetical protein DOY81_015509, partial [Sarcophaga bullata]